MKNWLLKYQKELAWPLFIFSVFIVTGFIYGQTLFFEFIYDDFPYLVGNRPIQGHTINPIEYILKPSLQWSSNTTQFYRPLGAFMYALEFRWFSFDPFYYHLMMIALHATVAILATVFVYLLFRNQLAAFFSGLLFLIHPINTEVVAWISEQSVLSGSIFVFLSLIFFLLYEEHTVQTSFLFSVFFAIIAPFFKEQVIVIPFLLAGCLLFLKLSWKKNVLYLLTYSLTVVPYLVMRAYAGMPLNQVGGWFTSKYEAALTMTHGLAYYIRLMFVPYPQTINYEWFPVEQRISQVVVLSAAAILFLIFIAIYYYKKAPEVMVGIYWFFVALTPVNNVVTPIYTYINERYLYLSSFGMIVAVVFLAQYYVFRLRLSEAQKNIFACILFLTPFLVLSYMTFARLPAWENHKVFWAAALDVDYDNIRNKTNYAIALQKEGNYVEAHIVLKSALRITDLPESAYIEVYRSIIVAALRFHDVKTARIYLIESLTRFPDNPGLELLEIKYYFAQKNYKKAEERARDFTDNFSFEKASKDSTLYEIPFYYLVAKKMNGDTVGVNKLLDQVANESIRQEINEITDARALMLQGKKDAALDKLYTSLKKNESPWLDAYLWLGELYEGKQDWENALAVYQTALYKNPANIDSVLGYERVLKQIEN